GAPEIVNLYLTGRMVDRNLRDAAYQRIVVDDEGAAQGRVVAFAVPVGHFRDALQYLLSARRDLQQLQAELQGIDALLVRHLVEKYLHHKLVRDVANAAQRSGPHPAILRNLTGILAGNIVARELGTSHELIVPTVAFAKENRVFSLQHAVAHQTVVVGDQLAGRVEAAAQIVRRNRAEMAVMDVVLARPHHLYRPSRTFRHQHGIDDKFLIVIATPSESAAEQRIVELDPLSRDTERSRRRILSRRRKLRPAPNLGGVAGGRYRRDRVQRLHLRVIGVVTAIFRFDAARGRRQRGFRITLLVPLNSRLLEIAGIGSERVQALVAVESPSLSA